MFREKLAAIEDKKLLRRVRDRMSPQGSRIIIEGKQYVNFSSNDYLGFANHPYLVEKAHEASLKYGFGAGASRLLCGGTTLHAILEENIARFKTTEAALVFNSGYAANSGIIPCLGDRDAVLLSDELNHASIIDGCRLSKAETVVYRHRDLTHLEECLKKIDHRTKIVITDSVFSMDGDIAPLDDIVPLCERYGAYLYIDDAHAAGVLGEGRGALSHFHIEPRPWIIQVGTFSKAFGSFGAFLTGSTDAITLMANTARSFIFSTSLPPSVIAASLAALELIERDREIVRQLWSKREQVMNGLLATGYDVRGSETPIIPIRTGSVENALRMANYLFEQGIFAPAIRPPSVIEPRIRITITAAHTDEDIERLIDALKKYNNRVRGFEEPR